MHQGMSTLVLDFGDKIMVTDMVLGLVIKYRGGGAMEIEGWVMNFSSHK